MDYSSVNELKRLEEQIFQYKPTLRSNEQQYVSNRLRIQLVESKAVVKIHRMDAECESLMKSLKQRLLLLQENYEVQKQKELEVPEDENIKLNLSFDSSDDETISTFMSKKREQNFQKLEMAQTFKQKTVDLTEAADTTKPKDSHLPLALRKQPRERKLSFKSLSSTSTSHSKANRKKLQNKQGNTVTTSGVTFHSEEMLVEKEMDETPTLHIKIPSLHRGNVHYIILDSLDFARKNFDYRANELKQQQQNSITHTSSKIANTRKKQFKQSLSSSASQLLQQFSQQHEQDLDLSQLIQNVMADACNDETLQATNALENINNNFIDNYEAAENNNFIEFSQSSQELSYSQKSNAIVDTACSTGNTTKKKSRKNSKRANEDEPPKKRGRKPRKKNDNAELQPQPTTKSNLAKYVEFFANDCEPLPGSTTPAASSTRSQPLVSSTTQNLEVVDHSPQQEEEQTLPQQNITYYIDGDWANGGPCQLVSTNGVSIDGRQLNQDEITAPFQDFVNYIDNSGDSGNNAIARVLECNNSLPISIPLPIANLGLQNLNPQYHQAMHQIHHSTSQNSIVPIINIQIPTLPNNIMSASAPLPAHTHKEVLDLSVKSKSSVNIISNEVAKVNQKSNNSLETSFLREEEECVPLDLSAKSSYGMEKQSETNCVTIDTQDEDFIRRLIEQSDFIYGTDDLKKADKNATSVNEHDNKSFKAALDMPLLDFDATDLSQLVKNTTAESDKQQENLTDINKEGSNYGSITAVNPSLESSLHFDDQSPSEIFNKLLDICPDNQFLDDINHDFTANSELNEGVFDQCRVENSTMYELENQINQKNQLQEGKQDICDTTSQVMYNEDMENTSKDSNQNAILSSDMSLNLQFSDNTYSYENTKLQQILNCKNYEVRDNAQQSSTDNEKKEQLIEVRSSKTAFETTNKNDEVHDTAQQSSTDNEKKEQLTEVRSSKTAFETTNKNDEVHDIAQQSLTDNEKEDQLIGVRSPKTSFQTVKNQEKIMEVENLHTTSKINQDLNKEKEASIEDKSLISVSTRDNEKNIKIQIPKSSYETDKIASKVNVKMLFPSQNTYLEKGTKKLETEIEKGKNMAYNKTLPKTYKNNNIKKLKEKAGTSGYENKPNENIVFSIAKITLSEEDNLFTTDSDSSSGKSFNVCEPKFMGSNEDLEGQLFNANNSCHDDDHKKNYYYTKLNESTDHEKNSLSPANEIVEQFVKETGTKDTQSCSNVLNLSLSVKNHNELALGAEEIEGAKKEGSLEDMDTSTNIDCAKVVTKNEEIKNQLDFNLAVDDENLTLLELESKLEDSLDFDEDFDDALSLATSCFDSPNDDRFEDSILDIEITKTADTLEDIEKSDSNPNPSSSKDITHFKIPKLNNVTATNTTDIVKKPKEITFVNTITMSDSSKSTLPKNMEKITRSVKNDLVQFNQEAETSLREKGDQSETTVLQNIFQNVFGITCLPYLVDKCYAMTHCEKSHQLNESEIVEDSLNSLSKIQINMAYQIFYNHAKLFKMYFQVFSSYYANKNDRIKLLNMVNDCERYPEHAEFLIVIYEALVKCGFSRVNACRLLLKRIRETSTATSIVEALVAIIMKSGWTMFTDFIEKYTEEEYQFNYRIVMLEQMVPAVLNSKGPHLKQVFGKCVQTLHRDDTGLLLNSPSLIQCVALLTTNT